MGGKWDHHQRVQQITEPDGNAETKLQGETQNGRFQREKDKGEAGVNEGGDRRSDIAEARAAGQQVNIDTIFCRIIGDGDTGQEQQQADQHDGGDGGIEPVAQGNCPADRFKSEKGNGTEGGVRDPQIGPAACAPGGEAKREIFQGFIRNPLIVPPTLSHDAKNRFHPLCPATKAKVIAKSFLRSVIRCFPFTASCFFRFLCTVKRRMHIR